MPKTKTWALGAALGAAVALAGEACSDSESSSPNGHAGATTTPPTGGSGGSGGSAAAGAVAGTSATGGSAPGGGDVGGMGEGGASPDSCPGVPIDLQGDDQQEHGEAWVDVAWLSDFMSGECGLPGPTAVFSFTPSISGTAVVTAAPDGDADATLTVAAECGTTDSTCVDDAAEGGPETLTVPVDAGHSYAITVTDAAVFNGAAPGSFTVTVDVGAPTNDTCPGQLVTWQGTGLDATFEVSGTTAGAQGELSPTSCVESTGGGDVVYQLTAPVSGVLALRLEANGDSLPLFFVRSACDDEGSELGCSRITTYTSDFAEMGRLALPVEQGESYFVVVTHEPSGFGPENFILSGSFGAAPTADTCPGESASFTGTAPSNLQIDVDGSTAYANDDATPTGCAATGFTADVVHRIVAPVAGRLEVRGHAEIYFPWNPAVYLRSDCTAAGSELGCSDGDETYWVLWHDMAAGETVYVYVDGRSPAGYGEYSLWVQLHPGAAGCPGADVVLSGSPPSATIQDSLSGFPAEQLSAGCDNDTGVEAVYHFVAPQSGTVTATLNPDYWDSSLYVRSGSCTGTEIACAAGNTDDQVQVPFVTTAGEHYYVIVDKDDFFSENYFELLLSY